MTGVGDRNDGSAVMLNNVIPGSDPVLIQHLFASPAMTGDSYRLRSARAELYIAIIEVIESSMR